MSANFFQAINDWLVVHGAKLAIIIVLAVIGWLIINKIAHRIFHLILKKKHREDVPDSEIEQRVTTLADVFTATMRVIIIFAAFLMILAELGINIAPLITGAGIAGLAIGFGAQNLVRDVIAGIFILLENQYSKGDVVRIAGISGMVEDINLRKTVLRDLDGVQHHIPNGEITTASNMTQYFARMVIIIGVSYETDIDQAIKVINDEGQKMWHEREWQEYLRSAPEVLNNGVEEWADSSINFKIVAETYPQKQWAVKREFLRRLKKRFDVEGIEIPYPHRTIVEKK